MNNKRNQILVGCGEWGFREMPLEEHFRIASKFGFKYLEFGIGGGQPGRLSEQPSSSEVESFLALSRQYQLQTPFCCLENDFTLADPAQHEAMLTKVLQQLRVAADCRATHVRLFAGFTPLQQIDEPRWQRLLAAFRICHDLCQQLGMQIAIETHGMLTFQPDGSAAHTSTVTTSATGLARLLDELPPQVGINYDPGNIKAAEPDVADLHLGLLNDRINYCHLKDWHRTPTGWQACAIGDDDLDYQPLLANMTFDGVYLIEYEPLEDPQEGIQRSLDYLNKVVADVRFE